MALGDYDPHTHDHLPAPMLADWLRPLGVAAMSLAALALAWGRHGGRRKLAPVGGRAHPAALGTIGAGVAGVVLGIALGAAPGAVGAWARDREHGLTLAYVGYALAMAGALAAVLTRPSRRQLRRLRRAAARRARASQRAASSRNAA